MRRARSRLTIALALAAGMLAVGVSLAPWRAIAQDAATSRTAGSDTANAAFGGSLVWAARWQTWIPVLYDPSYRQLPYPNGDVPWYIGVCTDVIVRAYRWFGIDLQAAVQRSGVGTGDPNIDHRRVEVLRRFFARVGQSLPVTDNPGDYKPGDIVSYYVPSGRHSTTHIAIVSDRKATGGTPLVIHNRGFGVQEENQLFAEKITGHYRYWPARD
jgi:uncharacterized protein YijF (DUF1287 family)